MKRLRTTAQLQNTCSVVVVVGGIDDADYTTFNNLIQNGNVQYPLLTTYTSALRQTYTDRYQVLATDATPDNITTAVNTVGSNGIVIVRLGTIPMYINSYLFSILSGLPAVYEGEGSASMILNSGKPFLHLVSSDLNNIDDKNDREEAIAANQLYPTIPLNAENSAVANQCHTDSLAMVQTLAQWEANLGNFVQLRPAQIVGSFIYESYVANTDKYNYFAGLRPFFHDQKQDKLMLGMIYTLGEITAADD
jgi:hypothetical protein